MVISDTTINKDIICWNSCLKLTNQDEKLALELIQMLHQQILHERDTFNQAFNEHNVIRLRELSHGLLGATSYCGVPKLRDANLKLHKQLQAPYNEAALKKRFNKLSKEIDAFLSEFKKIMSEE